MAMAPEQTGIGIRRHFTTEAVDPYDEVLWEKRDARITNFRDGSVAFEQRDVEFPIAWSQNATNIVAQKYFRGPLGSPERERSLRQVIDRVADTITAWGRKDGYFVDDDEAEAFRAELKHLILHQKAAFNSPVWFNIGVKGEPQQASACQPWHAPVSTPEGLVPIGQLVEERAVGAKVFDAHGLTTVAAVKSNGRKIVLRVHTRTGHALDVTADHLVWRKRGDDGRFVQARELERGDQLEWHRTESWGDGEIAREQVAQAALAGWLQADGFVARELGPDRSLAVEALTVSDAERRWVNDAIDVALPREHRHEEPVPSDQPGVDCRRLRIVGSEVARFADEWGLRARTIDAGIPAQLFSAPLPVVAAYLRSLFQAEGYLSVRERNATVGLAMASEQLVRGIQTLLMRFGIFSRTRYIADRRPTRDGCWVLNVSVAADGRRFADDIGFVDPEKSHQLETVAANAPEAGAPAVKALEIDHVEQLGEMAVYDIQTESGEYLSGNVRVHNCFILAVEDTMRSILNWYVEEGTIFKGGSGSGINLSKIRSSHEALKGGGEASGPVSFMRGADASAGTIKSAGKTRRAAKMVILDADHPDVEDFIWCKAIEERKARVLRDAGFDMDLDGRDSHSTQYQNANNSVRLTDDFMQAVLDDADWPLRAVTTGDTLRVLKARDLFHQIALAAWECADPGVQFDTTINRWHTASNTGRINASNPCSEYMHLDNSACNLASLNLLKFLGDDGAFDVDGFKAAVAVVFTAQEILVGNADYPTEKIGQNARRFRQLGLGYANLGALLMALGLPYDSNGGRAWAASITALMTGHAYTTSARTASRMGPFAGYTENRDPMNRVLEMHRDEASHIDEELVPVELLSAAQQAWDTAVELGDRYGVRNAQASVLAPTGCLVGGSIVATERGLVRLRSLGDPDGAQWQDLDIRVATDEGPRHASRFYVNGLEPVVSVETKRGYRIQGTPQHRVKVVDPATGAWQWRRFGEIAAGDLVPLAMNQLVGEPQSVALPPLPEAYWTAEHHVDAPRRMTAELAELIGYFMGDGSLHSRSLRFCVTAGDLDVVHRLEQLGKECFGVAADVVPRQGYTEVSFHSVRVVLWWDACGLARRTPNARHSGKGYVPHIPDAVLHSNDPAVYESFLEGLLGRVGSSSWSMASSELSSDVQQLLLALGCPTERDGSRLSGRLSERSTAKFISDKVVSAELSGEELTYDLSVPDNVTYIANGFVSHNTIGLMMDCDTTGVEPDLGLCKTKKLVGGGTMSIVNQTVPRALRRLGYSPEQVAEIIAYIDENKSIVGAPHLAAEHLPVFACSMGDNVIHYQGHVRMMGATQPFISGAISKCVKADTLLTTGDGLVRIGSLHHGEAPDSFRDEIMEVASLHGPQKTDAFYYGGVRPVRRAVLRSGHSVTGTPNHKLLVATRNGLEWKRLDQLERGDYVAMRFGDEQWSTLPAQLDNFVPSPRGRRHPSLPTVMTEDLAFLLGAYASEGCTVRGTVYITNSVPDVVERVAAAWRNLFEIEPRIVTKGRNECPDVIVCSRTVAELLMHLGCGTRASLKRIPDAVLRSPRSMVLAFLQGLALDAYVSVTSTPKWGICLDSPKLLDDLQAVLTNLGVVHRISKRNKANGKIYDEVYATGVHAQHLVELVPFLEPEKAARGRALTAMTFGNHNTADVVPGITPRDLYRLVPYRQYNLAGRRLRTEFSFLHDRRTTNVTRRSVERVAAIPGVVLPDWLRTVLDDGLHFSPVESVVDAGEREVFDVSVPATHAFVGNGIVNHNTVNVPEDVTVEDVEQLHVDAWRLGVKAIAIYRDNCKVAQPLATTKKDRAVATLTAPAQRLTETVVVAGPERPVRAGDTGPERPVRAGDMEPVRERLPRTRASKTFSFRVADCHGYVTVGEYEDGRPGEIFLRVAKQGSTLAGIMDAFAISVSHGLQYGVPLKAFVDMYTNMRFEPAGMTDDPDIRFASSLVDYIFRRLAVEYLPYDDRAEMGILTIGERTQPTLPGVEEQATPTSTGSEVVPDPAPAATAAPAPPPAVAAPPVVRTSAQPVASDAPYCYQCGMVMQRAGACFVCSSCGTTSGCS